MDFQRYILGGAIVLLSLILVTRWTVFKQDAGHADPATPTVAIEQPIASTGGHQEELLPSIDVASDRAVSAASPTGGTQLEQASNILVQTDVLKVAIDLHGGDITYVALPKYLAKIDNPDIPFVLLEKNNERTYIAQSGLLVGQAVDIIEGRPTFTSAQSSYDLGQDQSSVIVDLVFSTSNDINITKRFTFSRGSYAIKVQYLIANQSNTAWSGNFYAQITRDSSNDPGVASSAMGGRSYLGAAFNTPDEPYQKVSFKDMLEKSYSFSQTGGWAAMVQHYFVSAWIPNPSVENNYSTQITKEGLNILNITSPATTVAPGSQTTIDAAVFYAGPKDQYSLGKLSPGLELTVDYGWLWWIAQPLFALLLFFATGELHFFGNSISIGSGVNNWGLSIILLTVLVKLLFFKLSATSYRSMANMKKLQPKLLLLRERYGDDKQKMSAATMDLYKKEKVNPLGGCLPILIQMPVFIALYWTLMESVELRHAPFIGWIKDLSVMDPYYVLPIIMGASMFFQQKLNPPPPDPTQAKVMQLMPIIFTFLFLWFPAGLVLYWVVNNTLSIIQQWIITKQIEQAT